MTLGRVVDAKREETVETLVPAPAKTPPHMVRSQKPKYTMMQLLYDKSEDEDVPDAPAEVPPSLRHLPTSLL
jgi:hypothetical protein